MAKFKNKLQLFTYLYIYCILSPTLLPGSQACLKNAFQNSFEKFSHNFKDAMDSSSRRVSYAMTTSATKLESGIRTASYSLERSANRMAGSVDKATAELGTSVRKVSGDLVLIADKLTNSLDKGVEAMSEIMKEAMDTSKEISEMLTNSMDKAVKEIGDQIKNVVGEVHEIVKELTRSVDNAVDEIGETIRYMSDSIVEIAKQFNLNVDTADAVAVSQELKEAMVQSVEALSKNWEIAVNTADMKDVGASAAAELSKALQNINVKVEFYVGIDDNLRRAVKYISVAVGIAFSVLFIALVLGIRGCRSCIVKSVVSVVNRIQGRDSSENVDNSAPPEEELETVLQVNGKWYKRLSLGVKRNNRIKDDKESVKNTGRFDNNNATTKPVVKYDDDVDDTSAKKEFNKRSTRSLANYNHFSELKKKWENAGKPKQENNETSRAKVPEAVELLDIGPD